MLRFLIGLGVLAATAIAPTQAAAGPYVVLGDSIAAGFGGGGFANVLYADPGFRDQYGVDKLINRSVGGATAFSMIDGGQLATAIADIDARSNTRAVTVGIGGNDALDGCFPGTTGCVSRYRSNLRKILARLGNALIDDPGSEYFVTMAYYNPRSGTEGEDQGADTLLGPNHAIDACHTGAPVGLNDVIYQEAGFAGIPVADPYPAFLIGGQDYLFFDGIHPSPAGHAAIAAAFLDPVAAVACPGTIPRPHYEPAARDRTAPDTKITAGPRGKTDKRFVRFRFRATEAGSRFQCRLDRGKFRPCRSPKTLKRLKPGAHRLRVRAVDRAGNVDRSPAVRRFRVDGGRRT